ncbi:MAG: response regulator transcription factor [Anaerolineae bacterium]|nr:response regulator transcription factor [Anaerolineae bacterium]MDW8069640.1 response regulator transcription factor [Anaerolineae bacterium]
MPNAHPPRILVVDDEATTRVSLAELLRLEGYEVSIAASGEEALEILSSGPAFDLMVVDIKMPGMDGLQLTEAVKRRSSDTVIILLTAFGTLETAIQALRRGAHDYLLKPCPVSQILESVRKGLEKRYQARQRRVLVSRLERTISELRAMEQPDTEPPPSPPPVARHLEVQGVRLDRERYQAWVGNRPVDLTPTEFKLLSYLMEHADQVCSPQQLVRQVQGYETDPWGARAIIRVHVRRLRRKLEPDPTHPRYIINVRGVGYMFPTVPPEPSEPEPDETL